MISLRDADINDIELLRYWDTKPHVLASDPNDYWGWESDLSHPQPFWRTQLIAELDGAPIGFLQIIDPIYEESHYWGNVDENLRAIDIWIGEEKYLGKGYGTLMMKQAFKICFEDPKITAIIIDPLSTNKRAIVFYERLGFEFLESRIFGQDHCYVMKLTREQYQGIHLKE